MIRFDKFKVGDQVSWADNWAATMTGAAARIGNGPFEITAVFDRDNEPAFDLDCGQSLWQSMGHTQHVVINGDEENCTFSGKFFKLYEGAFS